MRRITTTTRPQNAAALTADPRPWLVLIASALMLAAAMLAATAAQATSGDDRESYGFVRRVEGDVLLAGVEHDDAIEAETNHPLLTGDRIDTGAGRVELVLADGSIVRVDRGTSVGFDALAGSPDSEFEGGTVLTLDDGSLQIRTPKAFFGGDDFAVRAANATVYLGAAGSYRITTKGSSLTQVVVREGFAEADTGSGSSVAREREALEISGSSRPFVTVAAAGPVDSLELWSGDLDRAAYAASAGDYIDPRLSYSAAPLHDSGEWLVVEARRVWRPYVRVDWRPFRYGRWVYTPSGLTWVASEPWGWVTSHYGGWDFVPGYGWLWYPGSFYQPAAVYWYWGPTYVGWIPYGYYDRFYGSGFGLSFGVHGWAGGDWGLWADWTFCPTRYFGRRGYDRYWDTGRNLAATRRFAVPRGIVTTDTRGLSRDRWGKPNEVFDTLVRKRSVSGRGGELSDVTDFVARHKLSETRVREVKASGLTSVRERLKPLAEDSRRGRLTTRTETSGSTGSTLRSQSGSSKVLSRGSSVRGSTDDPARRTGTTRPLSGVDGSSYTKPGTSVERSSGQSESSTALRERIQKLRDERDGEVPPLGSERRTRDRSGLDGASSLRDSSVADESAPARRVLDRIRAYRDAERSPASSGDDSRRSGSSSGSTGESSGGSVRSPESSRGDSSGSSVRDPSSSSSGSSVRRPESSRGDSSGSSARGSDSGSSRSSVSRSSSPPRQSSASSGNRSSSSSRSKVVRRPNDQ